MLEKSASVAALIIGTAITASAFTFLYLEYMRRGKDEAAEDELNQVSIRSMMALDG
jgi:hypothetical protein